MDSRMARGIVRDRSGEISALAWKVHDEVGRIAFDAAGRLASGRRLRPEDESRMRRDLVKLGAGNRAVVGSRMRTLGKRTSFEIVFAQNDMVMSRPDRGPAPGADSYFEEVQALRVVTVEWDRRRVFHSNLPTFVDVAAHVRRRFLERGGAADDIVARLSASLGIVLAVGAAARRAAPQAAHWPLFAPAPDGMTFGAATYEPVSILSAVAYRLQLHNRADRELPMPAFAPFGVPVVAPESACLVHALRTYVDNDALHEAQTALHARLLPLVERHAAGALAEFRRCFVDVEPAPGPAPEAAALLEDVAAAIDTPEGREASAYADHAWRTSSRARASSAQQEAKRV